MEQATRVGIGRDWIERVWCIVRREEREDGEEERGRKNRRGERERVRVRGREERRGCS